MKQLHLGNIANVAYGYSQILHQRGVDADVVCYDLDHPFSQPEWYDGDLSNDDLLNTSLQGRDVQPTAPSPPSWYRRIRILDLANSEPPNSEFSRLSSDWLDAFMRYSRRYGSSYTVRSEDVKPYQIIAETLAHHVMRHYDVVFGYAYAAAPPLLYSRIPYIPVEIGTLREIPFEDNAQGRLLAMAYRTAPHVVVTNPDVIRSIERLGVENYTFVPHPVDEDVWTPSKAENDLELHRHLGADYVLLAPARQDWRLKRNDKYLRAFSELIRAGYNAKLLIPGWGTQVEESKALIKSLGIQDHIFWLGMLPEKALSRLYANVDLVLDQFSDCGTFGLITPKALSCQCPVLLNYNPVVHEWVYTEHPPVISVYTEKEIYDALCHYLSHPKERTDMGIRGRNWILQHHSKSIIADRLQEIAEKVCTPSYASTTGFASLKQKRLELPYESAMAEDYDSLYHDDTPTSLADAQMIGMLRQALDTDNVTCPNILDLGCGPGSLTALLCAIPDAEVIGTDLSPQMINKARRNHPKAQFFVDDAEAMRFEDQTFDVVFCSGVLHHLPSLGRVLNEIHRVLKPGGFLIAREPNSDHFAARYPQLSFAHLCLSHYLNRNLYHPRFAETPAPEYHRDFIPESFTSEVAKVFHVSDLQFGMRVAYFYTMFKNQEKKAELESLEATLPHIPGLHMFLLAYKYPYAGMTGAVQKTLLALQNHPEISPEHYLTLYDLAWSMFFEEITETLDDPRNWRKATFREILTGTPHMKKVLIATDDPDRENKYRKICGFGSGSRWRRWWRKIKRMREVIPEFRTLASLGEKDMHAYDAAMFFITRNSTIEQFRRWMECVREYGVIRAALHQNATISWQDKSELQWLSSLNVTQTDGGFFDRFDKVLTMIRSYFTNHDFCESFLVALQAAVENASVNIGKEFEDLQKKVRNEWPTTGADAGFLTNLLNVYSIFINFFGNGTHG